MTVPIWVVAAVVLAMLVVVEVVDYLDDRADRGRIDLSAHDVETLPGGHLLHLSGCWCRTCQPTSGRPPR